MNNNTRACIAYIAGTLHGNNSSSIYDYNQLTHINIGGSVSNNSINIFDYSRSCHISGTCNNLYDHGNGKHINLNMNGSLFSGYDYDSGCHYSGNVNGRSIAIYDYETAKHYNYSI